MLKPDSVRLIDGDLLKKQLEVIIPDAKEQLIVISAYITQSGIDWLKRLVPANVKVHVVCRLMPSDILAGSTNISALQDAIAAGWAVSCLHSLHAKIYSIDRKAIYAGSANLTSNGLRIYGVGNIEACLTVSPTEENLSFIEKIETSSTALNEEILNRMQACIDHKEPPIYLDEWPEDILAEEEGVWVRDTFWNDPHSNSLSPERLHDLEIIGIQDFNVDAATIKKRLRATRFMKWLIEQLRGAPNNELFFGALTAALHDDIQDDPTPYRKDVKTLVQNLLSYCEKYLPDDFEISRPNYSQRIKLLVTR